MTPKTPCPKRKGEAGFTLGEAGFTLVEALIATFVLMFGLASIFNLMIVATTSNSVANRSSGAVAIAAQELEVLRATPFALLADSPVTSLTVKDPAFSRTTTVEGVGIFETRWLIVTDPANPNLKFLQVQTEPGGFRGRAARADFTTLRSCSAGTAAGCF